MQGTQRTQNLSLDLDYAFQTQKIVKVWKDTVRQFERKMGAGQWDKVFKRYFSLFGLVKDTCLENHLSSILAETPDLWGAAFTYLVRLSMTTK